MTDSIVDLLRQKKKQILTTWMRMQLADEALRDDLMPNEQLRNQSDELLTTLFSVLTDTNLTQLNTPEIEPLVSLLSNISMTRARLGYTPRETAIYIFSLKDALLETIQADLDNDPKRLYQESRKINRFVDSLGVVTFETFLQGREEIILRQTDEMSNISTPVVKVWDGILAMPIIGTIDSSRTLLVMENLLQEIVNTGSDIAILDISGVPMVDSMVAQHLIKTVNATRLMGAECIISGIRPEIAQTIVHLGIDLSNVVTKATLASALKYAFRTLRLEVKKMPSTTSLSPDSNPF
ncbi:STAS domain-containing protein [Spirosoma lituiforme]